VSGRDEERFRSIVTADPTVAAVLDRSPALGVVRPGGRLAPRHVYEA
jgi:hypothetical protein